MTEAAPIPEALARRGRDPLGEQVFQSSSLRVIEERDGEHIPSFYVPHEDPAGTVVTQGGVPVPAAGGKLSFTVADVAPERRWAITESGELLPQHKFESMLVRKLEEWYERVARVRPPGDLKREVFKQVQEYVNRTPDPVDPRKLKRIGFDPHRPPPSLDERTLYDPKKDEEIGGEDRMLLLEEAYDSPRLRKTLRPYEIDAVERRRGTPGLSRAGSDVLVKLEHLNEMLTAGDITPEVHSRRVSELTGTDKPEIPAPSPEPVVAEAPPESPTEEPKPEPEPAPASESKMTQTLCGKSMTREDALKHKRGCAECRRLKWEKNPGGDEALIWTPCKKKRIPQKSLSRHRGNCADCRILDGKE